MTHLALEFFNVIKNSIVDLFQNYIEFNFLFTPFIPILQLQRHKNTNHYERHFPKRIPKVSSKLVIIGKPFSDFSKKVDHMSGK
jgi:hypothetical protein